MMVPYAHMTLVALNKPLAEPDVQALFGNAALPAASANAMPAVGPRPAADTPVSAKPKSVSDANLLKPAVSAQPKPPSKSVLLARLRERLAEKAK